MASPLAVLTVAVTADTRALVTGMNAAIGAVGLLAGAALKSAADFDASFTRIASLSNTSSGAIEGMKEEVMALAGETAQSPKELADALFFLASAGLDAAEVMPALEASAKASAVGLGDTADVASIVASALNAYADSGLTAAQATDVLVAAVREGRAEPEEFAGALGRILPIASTVGVTFDEVTASLAALSNIGLDVNEGVTAMRGVLQAIAAPGKQAAEAMEDLGLSAQDLLDAISEDGLFGAIRLLDRAAKQNTQTQADYNGILRKVVPNVRSLTGVLGLTAQEASKVNAIFENVRDSTGDAGEAFRTTAESDAFQLQKAMNDVAIALQRVGAEALPFVADAAGFAAANIETLGIAFAAFAALKFLPPLLFQIGLGLEAVGAASTASKVGNLAGSLQGLAGPIGAAIAVVAGLKIATDALARSANEATGRFVDLANAVGSGEFEGSFRELNLAINEVLADKDLPDWVREFAEEQAPKIRDAFLEQREATLAAIDAQEGLATAAREGVGAATEAATAQREQAAAHLEAAAAAREQRLAELELAGGLLGVLSSADALQESQAELTRLTREGKQGTEEYRDATRDVLSDSLALRAGLVELGGEMIAQGKSGEEVAETLTRIGRNAGLTKGDIRALFVDVQGLTGDLDELGKRNPKPKVTLNDAEARKRVATMDNKLHALTADQWAARVVVDDAAARASIAALDNELHALTADQWDVRIHATTTGGSTAFDLIDHLERALRNLVSADWTLEIRADADATEAEIRAAETALKAAQDQVDSFLRDFAALEKRFDRVNAKVEEFSDAIRSGFEQFDLIGGAVDLLDRFNQEMAEFLEAQAAGTLAEGAVAPTAPDLGAFVGEQAAQAQELADVLTALSEAGLNQKLLADLAAQGPAGIGLGTALLENPELIKQFNQAQKQIAEAIGETTKTLIEDQFGKQIRKLGNEFDRLSERLRRFLDTLDEESISGIAAAIQRLERLGGLGGGGGDAEARAQKQADDIAALRAVVENPAALELVIRPGSEAALRSLIQRVVSEMNLSRASL